MNIPYFKLTWKMYHKHCDPRFFFLYHPVILLYDTRTYKQFLWDALGNELTEGNEQSIPQTFLKIEYIMLYTNNETRIFFVEKIGTTEFFRFVLNMVAAP